MTLQESMQQGFSYPIIVADIGGTNARFGLITSKDSPLLPLKPVATGDFPDIGAAMEACLKVVDAPRPKTAVIAVAGPVTGNEIPLTNAAWVIEPLKLLPQVGLTEVIVLNDFEAQALALPGYQAGDIEQIGSGETGRDATKFVLGPGTGLGAAAMIRATDLWVPVPGEGGHVEVGPVGTDEFEIWRHLELVGGRLGAEQILSGTGMPRLARAVAAAHNAERHFVTAADITSAAMDNDEIAVLTLQTFAKALGRVAGDFALSLLARGGIYLTGGVTPRIDRFLTDGRFRAAFEAKAPHEKLMAKIPTFIVRHSSPALAGLAAYATAPECFSVDTRGRRWRDTTHDTVSD